MIGTQPTPDIRAFPAVHGRQVVCYRSPTGFDYKNIG